MPELQSKMKCIIIAVDAGGRPDQAFRSVKKQIADAGFSTPDRALEIGAGGNGLPATAVILIPPAGSGGLETLCIRAFSEASEENAKLLECQTRYFESSPTKPNENWGAEARDKGAFQCLIAASCEDNPSMPTRLAFLKRKKVRKPPVIDIGAAAFIDVVNAIKAIMSAIDAH